jgi:hypothetical protein
MSREKWASRIAAAWQKQVPSIFEVGALLESAKAELKHGEWIAMAKSELPFTRTTATRLMQVAACDHLRNDAHAHHLPAHWPTLCELTKLTTAQFEQSIASGAINPKMQRKDVKALRGENVSASRKKPQQPPAPSSIDPVDRCIMRVHALILEWLPEIPSSQHERLLAELRREIDQVETIIDKRRGEANGHHAACQSA